MSVALVGGYVDTGITASFTFECYMHLTRLELASTIPDSDIHIRLRHNLDFYQLQEIQFVELDCDIEDPSAGVTRHWQVITSGPGFPSHVEEEYVTPGSPPCEASSTQHDGVGTYRFYMLAGPFRLGIKYEPSGDPLREDDLRPKYVQRDYQIQYHWFSDEATTLYVEFAGRTSTRYWIGGGTSAPSAQTQDEGLNIGSVTMGGNMSAGGSGIVRGVFSAIQIDGVSVDASGLNRPNNIVGHAGGQIDVYGAGGGSEVFVSPAWDFEVDMDVSKFGAGTLNANIDVPDYPDHSLSVRTVASPYTDSWVVRNYSWEARDPPGQYRSNVNLAWAALQNPVPVIPADKFLTMLMSPPFLTSTPNSPYYPVSIEVLTSVDVEQQAARPSQWVTDDAAKITVDSADGSAAVFHVTDASGTVSRTLTDAWKHRAGLFGTGDADFDIAAHAWTQHRVGEDVYCWDTYRFLRLELDAADVMTLHVQLDGGYLEVTGAHGPGTPGPFAAAYHPFTYTYLIALPAGASVKHLDLCFPTSGAADIPAYPSRIDKITLSGFPVGDSSLSAMALEETGSSWYFKIAYGTSVRRIGADYDAQSLLDSGTQLDYSCLVAAVDGSMALGNLPDSVLKADEGDIFPGSPAQIYGGGLRYIVVKQIDSLDPAFAVQDYQLLLKDFLAALDGLEGFSATYDQSAHDAACKDAYGTDLGPELTQWLLPVTPHQLVAAGVAGSPPCEVAAGLVVLPNKHHFKIVGRHNLWGALEALVTEGSGPAGAGHVVSAIGPGPGASGVTDAQGFVTISPVPAYGDFTLQAT